MTYDNMRTETAHWWFTTNETWQFHSFDGEPAIVENSYTKTETAWEWEQMTETHEDIEWYKAWYNNWVIVRVERDWGEVFSFDEDWNLIVN